jgi:isoleucyl-tRNA synthetase
MDTLDRWALHQTANSSRLHRRPTTPTSSTASTSSATSSARSRSRRSYHDILKDRLYTLAADHPLRRSSQTAIHQSSMSS